MTEDEVIDTIDDTPHTVYDFGGARAYALDIGRDSRIIVHDRGLPPGWNDSNIDRAVEFEALRKRETNCAVHLRSSTLEKIVSYPLK